MANQQHIPVTTITQCMYGIHQHRFIIYVVLCHSPLHARVVCAFVQGSCPHDIVSCHDVRVMQSTGCVVAVCVSKRCHIQSKTARMVGQHNKRVSFLFSLSISSSLNTRRVQQSSQSACVASHGVEGMCRWCSAGQKRSGQAGAWRCPYSQ